MRRHLKTLGVTAALAVVLAANPAQANHGHDRGYASGSAFMVDPALAERCGLGAGSIRPHREFASYDYGYDNRRRRDSGIGGALVGGAVGGLLGNRIAGRGDRVIGSVAGAAVGAIAGAAIDRAGDDRNDRYSDGGWRGDRGYDDRGYDDRGYDDRGYISDECDAVLPAGYRLVSVPGGQECRDEVTTTEEWVSEDVTIPGRPSYSAPVGDKRTKLRRVK